MISSILLIASTNVITIYITITTTITITITTICTYTIYLINRMNELLILFCIYNTLLLVTKIVEKCLFIKLAVVRQLKVPIDGIKHALEYGNYNKLWKYN